jgi:NADPH:quinone reductase-like Zn-dependent oxidoreductase
MNAGVDVILDCVGGAYLSKNVDCLAFDGRLFIIGFQGGIKRELILNTVLFKQLTDRCILRHQSSVFVVTKSE